MRIKRVEHVTNMRPSSFYYDVREIVESLGDYAVEIQYSTTTLPTGGIVYSALIIGREAD